MTDDQPTLTQRMFTAARIIDEVRSEYAARNGMERPSDSPVSWSAHDLRTFSDRWDREDAEKAAELAAVEELAVVLWLANPFRQRCMNWSELGEDQREDYRIQAREVIASGYSKGGA